MIDKRIVIISGEKNVGKTKLINKLIPILIKNKIKVTGVYSPAKYFKGKKTGIFVKEISTKKKKLLAELKPGWDSRNIMREWKMDNEAIIWGNAVIQNSIPTSILIIDELGFLEFEENQGWTSAFRILEGNDFDLAIVVVRNSLLNFAQSLWKESDTILINNPKQSDSYAEILSNQIIDTYRR